MGQSQLLELSNTHVVSLSDSIEALAHDHVHNKLAVTTNYGEVRLYTVEKSGKIYRKNVAITHLWQ